MVSIIDLQEQIINDICSDNQQQAVALSPIPTRTSANQSKGNFKHTYLSTSITLCMRVLPKKAGGLLNHLNECPEIHYQQELPP